MKKGPGLMAFFLMTVLLSGCTSPWQLVLFSEETTSASVAPEETTNIITSAVDPLVTDRYHLEYDSPGYCRLDISIPLLREDLPGAEEINEQIAEDYRDYLDKEPEEFDSMEWSYSYPMVHIHYEQFLFGDLLELVVRYEAYSLYGSGPASFNTVYCYDLKEEKVSSLSRLMEQLDISEKAVVAAYGDYYGLDETERGRIHLEEKLVGQFYLEEEGTIQIEANQ